MFVSTAGRETTGSSSSEVSYGYRGDVENLSEHDEIVENCFEEPTVKKETTSNAQCQEEARTLLSEGITTNLPACTLSRSGQGCKLPVKFVRKQARRWNKNKKKTSDAQCQENAKTLHLEFSRAKLVTEIGSRLPVNHFKSLF